jgi:hypothetical protein
MSVRYWLTKELWRGDLHALSAAARGDVFDLDPDQIKRLRARGYLRRAIVGGFSVTTKGRFALAMRRVIGKDRLATQWTPLTPRERSPSGGGGLR